MRHTRMTVDLDQPPPETVEAAAAAVLGGGVVVSPTDTIYGLHCHPFQPSALERLLRLKERPEEKGFLMLIPEISWVHKLSPSLPRNFQVFADLVWPGPITVLLEGRHSLSPLILGREKKVGIRMPDKRFLRAWMEKISAPLVSTSANLSGQPMPASLKELRQLFQGRADLFLELDAPLSATASSVVDLTYNPPRIIRRAAASERLEAALKAVEEMGL